LGGEERFSSCATSTCGGTVLSGPTDLTHGQEKSNRKKTAVQKGKRKKKNQKKYFVRQDLASKDSSCEVAKRRENVCPEITKKRKIAGLKNVGSSLCSAIRTGGEPEMI